MPDKGIPSISVSDEVRVEVERIAKKFCDERQIPYEQFNQDCCAVTAARCCKHFAADLGKSVQAMKVCSNASALRQKISGETGGKKKATQTADELAKLVG